MLLPVAVFDALAIATRIGRVLGSTAYSEFHLFSYLACLLSLYRRRPLSDWEYGFAGTKDGAPFSHELHSGIELATRASFLIARDNGHFYALTDAGRREYLALRPLSINCERDRFLDGACSSLLALPIGTVRLALACEPELHRAIELNANRRLLEEGPGFRTLYEQFGVLSERLGVDVQDLMVPAVVWLTYLVQSASSGTQQSQ